MEDGSPPLAPPTEHVRYLTAEELVERYRGKVTRRTLANWRSSGDGPKPTKIGGRVLYSLAGVIDWELARTRKT